MNQILKSSITCHICGNETEERLISKTFFRFGQNYTFDNIKAQVCLNCGEKYFPSESIIYIENQIKNKTAKPNE